MVDEVLLNFFMFYIRVFRKDFITNQTEGIFVKPIFRVSSGKDFNFGAPYFKPRNYCSSIFIVRIYNLSNTNDVRSSLRTNKLFDIIIFQWNIKCFIGFPIKFICRDLQWKEKFHTPRAVFSPQIGIYYFGRCHMIYIIPPKNLGDTYWEMILWWKYYCEENLTVAEKTWKWEKRNTLGIKVSSWDNSLVSLYDMKKD
jgi:hypothetical protein